MSSLKKKPVQWKCEGCSRQCLSHEPRRRCEDCMKLLLGKRGQCCVCKQWYRARDSVILADDDRLYCFDCYEA